MPAVAKYGQQKDRAFIRRSRSLLRYATACSAIASMSGYDSLASDMRHVCADPVTHNVTYPLVPTPLPATHPRHIPTARGPPQLPQPPQPHPTAFPAGVTEFLTCEPFQALYGFQAVRPGRQYSRVNWSANSLPWPLPKRPCTLTALTTRGEARFTCRYSRVPLVMCRSGHQAPPPRSTFSLRTVRVRSESGQGQGQVRVRITISVRSGSDQGQVSVRSGSGQGQVRVRSGSGQGQVRVRSRSGSGQ